MHTHHPHYSKVRLLWTLTENVEAQVLAGIEVRETFAECLYRGVVVLDARLAKDGDCRVELCQAAALDALAQL
jgi:hypothetical protein